MTKESYNFGVDTEAKRLYTETSGMTKNRFRHEYVDDEFSVILDDFDGGRECSAEELTDRLNQLTRENEQLKKENKKLADAITVYFQSKIKGDVE